MNKFISPYSLAQKNRDKINEIKNAIDVLTDMITKLEKTMNDLSLDVRSAEEQLSRLTSDQIVIEKRIPGLLDYCNKLISRDERREKQIGLISDTNNNLIDRIVKLEEITEHLDKDCWGE